jgi:hypothetical protein
MVTLAAPASRGNQPTIPFIQRPVAPEIHHREFVPELPCLEFPIPLLDANFDSRPDLLPIEWFGRQIEASGWENL